MSVFTLQHPILFLSLERIFGLHFDKEAVLA
jgi:hypothetical protein